MARLVPNIEPITFPSPSGCDKCYATVESLRISYLHNLVCELPRPGERHVVVLACPQDCVEGHHVGRCHLVTVHTSIVRLLKNKKDYKKS